MWEALRRLADTSQRLLVDRLELVRLETREDVVVLARALALFLATLPLLLMGWIAVMAGLVLALTPVLPLSAILGLVGGTHVVIGGVGAYLGLSRLSAGDTTPETTVEAGEGTEARHAGNGRETRGIGDSYDERAAGVPDRRADRAAAADRTGVADRQA